MSNVPATRAALLQRTERIKLASQGRDLLEQKQAALMEELMAVAERVLHETSELEQASATARASLARAKAEAGEEAVRSAALAALGELPIRITWTNVMSVYVPDIEHPEPARSPIDRGYSIGGMSLAIEDAARAFENEVETILALAKSELRLRRLVAEIRRTSRRLNVLDHVLIPRLEEERDTIEETLSERERENHFRLKLAKRSLMSS